MGFARNQNGCLYDLRKPRVRATLDEIIENSGLAREQIQAVLESAAERAAPSRMRVLFDKIGPDGLARLRRATADDLYRGRPENGGLLAAAEQAEFALFLIAGTKLMLTW